MRSITTTVAIILWMILGYLYYCCGAVCHENPIVSGSSLEYSVLFENGDSTPITGNLWGKDLEKILDNLGANEMLTITGKYYSDEENNSTFDNLGIARAEAMAAKLMPPLDRSQIKIDSELLDGDAPDDKFPAVSFIEVIVENPRKIDDVDKHRIYFPFNSTDALDVDEMEVFLDEVADDVNTSGMRVMLTGHTDDIGPLLYNEKLGMWRAERIEKYLLDRGVRERKIITITKGETLPAESNETSEGRAKNRRTVLRVVK